jgi:large subunit ribosomal protein L32
MGLPAKRRTRRSKRERAAHFALGKTTMTACPACGAPMLPHTACPKCGQYRGRQAGKTKKRTERAMRKAKRRA